MPYDPSIDDANPDKKSVFGVIVHSFFVIPFLLAIFSVLLLVSVRILTMEKRDVNDYLEDVKTGSLTKRWQSAFELSRILSNPTMVPHDEKFTRHMMMAFEKSKNDDDRVRQYLALAMGKSGIQDFVDVLMKAAPEEKDENLYAIITSLGILKNNKAIPVLLNVLNNDNAHLRLVAVIALGNIADGRTIAPLKHMLNDPQPNVSWDAAIALAKMGNKSGKAIILNLLDRHYLDQIPHLNPQEQSRIMMVAISTTATWHDADIKNILKELFDNDKNMNVRTLARRVWEESHG
ncbi:MAG: HEAT repeat domain-containing protein [Candidatus Omnitrophica bacterium]|nr:HEAT repeat domain-containing protein [Candidatus Omnitrophota bacterium]